jgi:hypothetical protein
MSGAKKTKNYESNAIFIAASLNVSASYVRKVLSGDREKNSLKAKQIINAHNRIKAKQLEAVEEVKKEAEESKTL